MKILRITNNKNGFTLIELIVAMGIFFLVLGMTSGIFILALSSQRRIIALRNIEDNARFALESMAREIRTGKDFDLLNGSLFFTNAKNESVVYHLSNGVIEKSVNGGTTFTAITVPETTINYLNFYLQGQVANDKLQPRITVAIGITSQIGTQNESLKVQTTISERLIQS